MSRDEIRKKTGVIIKKDGEYLVGTSYHSSELKWSNSPYDAWITRNISEAERVNSKICGQLMLFNPIVNQIRALVI